MHFVPGDHPSVRFSEAPAARFSSQGTVLANCARILGAGVSGAESPQAQELLGSGQFAGINLSGTAWGSSTAEPVDTMLAVVERIRS